MKYKALFLDLDNTIVDSESAYLSSLSAVFERYEYLDFELYNMCRNMVKDRMPAKHTSARNRAIYFKLMLEEVNSFSPTLLASIIDHYELNLFQEISGQVHKLDRQQTLRRLSTLVPIVVITNENLRTQLVKLKAIDPNGKLVHRVLTSEEAAYEKPNKKIFEMGLKAINCKPEECLMVGDSIDCDILPSLDLGFKALLTTEFTDNINEHYTGSSIKKLEELESIIAS